MARLLVLYHTPVDPGAFDDYYHSTHVDIAKKIPGLVSYRLSRGTVMGPEGAPAPYHLVAELEFATKSDLDAARASAEGKAAGDDLVHFAQAGATILLYDTVDA